MLKKFPLNVRAVCDRLKAPAIVISGIIIGMSGAGAAYGRDSQKAPGLYQVYGWSNGGNSYEFAWVPGATQNVANDIDVNGELGHPLYVSGPTANCAPGQWSGPERILTGRFPAGVSMKGNGDLTGIPTERGHFIVTLVTDQITCNGSNYPGFRQEVRFHITGSGEVVQ